MERTEPEDDRSLVEQVKDALHSQVDKAKEAWNDQEPIGKGHASAMFRLGLSELRNAVDLTSDGQNITDSELGLYGTQTPGEIAQGREDSGNVYGFRDHEEEHEGPSLVEQARALSPENQPDRGQEQDHSHGR